MADEKIAANGNAQYWVIPQASLTTPAAPIPSEVIASGLNLSEALAWDGTTFPTAEESNDVDDRSIMDRGNASSRGFAQMTASLNFFRPDDVLDTVSGYGKAFQFFKKPRVPVYLIARILQGDTGVPSDLEEGQWVSVLKMMAVTFVDDTEGEDSYKYTVDFLPQGAIWAKTQTQGTEAVGLNKTDLTLASGDVEPVRATLNGLPATQTVKWASDDVTVAQVSANGVVTGVGAGEATISASHPAATGEGTVTATVS